MINSKEKKYLNKKKYFNYNLKSAILKQFKYNIYSQNAQRISNVDPTHIK